MPSPNAPSNGSRAPGSRKTILLGPSPYSAVAEQARIAQARTRDAAIAALKEAPRVPRNVVALAENRTPLHERELAVLVEFLRQNQKPIFLVDAQVLPCEGKRLLVDQALSRINNLPFSAETDGQLILRDGLLHAYFCRQVEPLTRFPFGSFYLSLPKGEFLQHQPLPN